MVEVEFVKKQMLPFTERENPPWDGGGNVFAGDFIIVMQGDLAGKEGLVKTVIDGFTLEVTETSKDPDQPEVIAREHVDAGVEMVSHHVDLLGSMY